MMGYIETFPIMQHDYTIHFDGSCLKNPGGRCFYGFTVHRGEEELLHEGHGELFNSPKTNNIAEIFAVEKAIEWFSKNIVDARKLTIFGDSKLAVNCISKKWRTHKPHIRSAVYQVRRQLDNLKCRYTLCWIPRLHNQLADSLSKQQI